MSTDQTTTDQLLPLDEDSAARIELDALRAEVPALRAIADAARYFYGHEECLENECDCDEYVDEDGQPRPGLTGCPNLETRYADVADALVRERLEYLVDEVLNLLDQAPEDDETGATVRAAVRDEIQRCGMYALQVLDDHDPRAEQARPAVFERIRKAYHDDLQATLAAIRGGPDSDKEIDVLLADMPT